MLPTIQGSSRDDADWNVPTTSLPETPRRIRFEGGDLLAHRRLGESERPGALGERPLIDDGDERSEVAGIDVPECRHGDQHS
jgi:hypothetical protein